MLAAAALRFRPRRHQFPEPTFCPLSYLEGVGLEVLVLALARISPINDEESGISARRELTTRLQWFQCGGYL